MRGRRPDVASQEAKGNPGKRRRKLSIDDRIKQLAEAPATAADVLAPPAMFGVEEFAGAIAIWNEYAPMLRRRNMLDRLDRHTLAMFCYYLDRFWTAVKQIAAEGATQRVKTVAGGYMVRDHPAIRHRDDAGKVVLDLGVKFGFSPLDRHRLIREMAGAGQPIGGMIGDGDSQQTMDVSPQPDDDAADDISGFAARNASASGLPN